MKKSKKKEEGERGFWRNYLAYILIVTVIYVLIKRPFVFIPEWDSFILNIYLFCILVLIVSFFFYIYYRIKMGSPKFALILILLLIMLYAYDDVRYDNLMVSNACRDECKNDSDECSYLASNMDEMESCLNELEDCMYDCNFE